MRIYDSVIDLIGKTPIVRYDKNILLKLEYFNPSNSIKDRASYYMLKEAKEAGLINENTKIIEPTSGNTGIGLSMCCAYWGLELIIIMPENMSEERKKAIAGYGAKLILTPKEEGMDGAVKKAKEIAKEYPNSFIPMQFSNPSNPKAHEETTAKEIFEDTDGEIDIVVAGIGTGGTAIGIRNGLKKLKPEVKVYGIEPEESPIITEGHAGAHKIQGIGANFITDIYRNSELDGVFTVKSEDAIKEARSLAKSHGIMCGISSGANVCGAKKLAEKYPGKLILTTINDIGERYLSTELFDNVI